MEMMGHEVEGPEPMHGYQEHMGNMGHMGHMDMRSYFHFGYGDTLFFQSLKIDSSLKMILSCAALFILAMLLEALNYIRRLKCECELRPLKGAGEPKRKRHEHGQPDDPHSQERASQPEGVSRCCSDRELNGVRSSTEETGRHCECSLFRAEDNCYRCVQAILYLTQTTLALALMLAAMTYNVCIIFAIVSGAGFGYYVFYRPFADVQICH